MRPDIPTPEDTLSLDFQLDRGSFELRIALELPARGITAITGPSGSGKTSLLRAIAGLEPAIDGHVQLGTTLWQGQGVQIPPHQRGIGMVFQEPRLFPNMNLRENLMYGAKRAGFELTDVMPIAEAFDLVSMLERKVQGLSGGEQRRVSLARALAAKPRLLLLDEPLTGLDADRKADIFQNLLTAAAQSGCPMLYVTHDPAEVNALADHCLRMVAGRLLGPPEAILDRYEMPVTSGGTGPDIVQLTPHQTDEGLRRVHMPATSILISLSEPPPSNALGIFRGEIQSIVKRPDGTTELWVQTTIHCIRALQPAHGQIQDTLRVGQTVWLSALQMTVLPGPVP